MFFFKQKTACEVRISDLSSDVCSSDLQLRKNGMLTIVWCAKSVLDDHSLFPQLTQNLLDPLGGQPQREQLVVPVAAAVCGAGEIGRASCRERGCKYGETSVVAVAMNKKSHRY